MRLLVQHFSRYAFPQPARFGPHLIRLRPASHTRARVESYALEITQPSRLRWQQDPYGNHIARVTFPKGSEIRDFEVGVQLVIDVRPVNPFDFYLDDSIETTPFEYPEQQRHDLAPFLSADVAATAGPRLREFLASLPDGGRTVDVIVELNRRVNQAIRYVIREESGVWTPEETLEQGRGSCRDSAVLLMTVLRSRGFAARFVSGYLVQLRDDGMLPDQPRGLSRDVMDLHAWTEVYLPGAGWIGLDATSGLMCGEGHVPLACTASPATAAPLEGTTSVAASRIQFETRVSRIAHEPQPTAPYEEPVWQALGEAARRTDEVLGRCGFTLTSGGEPTFVAREGADAPEWNTEALGPTKLGYGFRLAEELVERLTPGGVVLQRSGKHYPGESLPRWALEIIGRRDRVTLWQKLTTQDDLDMATARRVVDAIAARLGVAGFPLEAREDPWRHLQIEASLPVEVDPLKADLKDGEARRRLARILDRGLGEVVGFALPLKRSGSGWISERWRFRRDQLFLIPGDSSMGLRLPLSSLGAPRSVDEPREIEAYEGVPDPRRVPPEQLRQNLNGHPSHEHSSVSPSELLQADVRTALCVEPRDGRLYVFLPPLPSGQDFIELVEVIDAVRAELGVSLVLEGYPPPPSPLLARAAVTPDPGVLEVNVPPSDNSQDYEQLMLSVFEGALKVGLHSEKYLVDGRISGSGGGHHLTLGGPTPLTSPFLQRPDLLASLLTFFQHHPSLSYMFTGLFVGPTSQAPRVDEARHDSLYELEIALSHLFAKKKAPPWLGDWLLRNLLVDVSGNTHRTEICIDKLFDPGSAYGRQGLLEFRAFEMPPHPRMAVAQMYLVRALLAALATQPYHKPLVSWGQVLHDRFLLPFWMWRDFEDVLELLGRRGVPLPSEAFRPFLELRCPVVGELSAGDVTLELRNAIEPWHVLGEQVTASGTSRFVDSSMERVQVRAVGLIPERHSVLVNGRRLPLRATGAAQEYVAGVRFRAWMPPFGLQPHLGIHHPLRFEVLDDWAERSLGACAYHVWHPEGRTFDAPPLTRFEAAARRAQRFTLVGPTRWPVRAEPAMAHPDAPYTLDLRRLPVDHPMPPAPDTFIEDAATLFNE